MLLRITAFAISVSQSGNAAAHHSLYCNHHLRTTCRFRAFNKERLRAFLVIELAVAPGVVASDAAFWCPIGESSVVTFLCFTGELHDGDSDRYAANDSVGQAGAGNSVAAGAGESCGQFADNSKGDVGESACKFPSNIGHAVTSTCSTVHAKLGGGAGKLCSHMPRTAPSAGCDVALLCNIGIAGKSMTALRLGACKLFSHRSKTSPASVGTNLCGSFNACVARLARSVGTVTLSSTGQGTSKRFRCLKQSSKHASVWAGALKYSCNVCNTTGAAPSLFRIGVKTWIA